MHHRRSPEDKMAGMPRMLAWMLALIALLR
jgi:hypothetical protein